MLVVAAYDRFLCKRAMQVLHKYACAPETTIKYGSWISGAYAYAILNVMFQRVFDAEYDGSRPELLRLLHRVIHTLEPSRMHFTVTCSRRGLHRQRECTGTSFKHASSVMAPDN